MKIWRLSCWVAPLILLSACDSGDQVDLLAQAQAQRAAGQIAQSIVSLNRLLEREPESVTARSMRADLYVEARDYKKAAREFRYLKQMKAPVAALDVRLIEAQIGAGFYDEALRAIDALRPRLQQRADIQALRAKGMLGTGKLTEAEALLMKVQEAAPEETDTAFDLAKLYFKQTHFRKAAAQLEQIPEHLRKRPDVVRLDANVSQVLGRYARAKAGYQWLMDNEDWGTWPPPEVGMARAQIFLGEVTSANQKLQQYLKRRPNDVWASYYRAMGAFIEEDYLLAERLAQSVMVSAPQYPPVFLLLGASRFALDDFDQADKALALFLSKHGEHHDAGLLKTVAGQMLELNRDQRCRFLEDTQSLDEARTRLAHLFP